MTGIGTEDTLTAVTAPGETIGTLLYMSPEQVRGKRLDARTDLFSFGVVLYEMATGALPFRGATAGEVANAILSTVPVSPLRLNATLAPELAQVIGKCLNKYCDLRYQTAATIRDDFKRIAGSTIPATIERKPTRSATKSPSRLWTRFALLVLIAGALVTAAFLTSFHRPLPGIRAPEAIHSIAVLPLQNLTHDPEQDYFADGMTDELITGMGKVASLRVISRTSAMRYRDSKLSLPQIAKELGVDAVVEGSVLRSGSRVRINTQLIQTLPERELWSHSYERELADVLAVQSDVAGAIIYEIRGKLAPPLINPRTVDPVAYEAYLHGRNLFEKRNKEAVGKAIEFYRQAIARDPTYAPAYAALADAFTLRGSGAPSVGDYRIAFANAKEAALRAVELDDDLAEAHAALGHVYFLFDWNFQVAEREQKRAIELNPGYAIAHQWFGLFLSSMGRTPQAFQEMTIAQELDPLSPSITGALGDLYLRKGDYQKALQQDLKALELEPNQFNTRIRLAICYSALQRYDQALAELDKAEQISPGSRGTVFYRGLTFALKGDKVATDQQIRQLQSLPTPVLFEIAVLKIASGRREEGLQLMEKAYSAHEPRIFTYDGLGLGSIRQDPRFQQIQRRAGVPDAAISLAH
jgi:eukaryotic-like serine/threonine-protein kinase